MTSDGQKTGLLDKTILAKTCAFQALDMRWVPSGEESVKINIVRNTAGTVHLQLGTKEVPLAGVRSVSQLAPCFVSLEAAELGHVGLQVDSEASTTYLFNELSKRKADYERFEQYEQGSVQSYFQYYAKLDNQQNMLQDGVRTSIYRQAIVENPSDFVGAKVMDIGAGSGILSFFAAQTGASGVYAVEASSMSETVQVLADANGLGANCDFKVIGKPLEKITDEVVGKVDVLISEPIGTFLFNERMIETYLVARDRFLKPGGKMFPNVGDLCIAPFSDPMLHWEQQNKNQFWKNTNFYGLDLTSAVPRSNAEHFRQPVVDYINPEFLVAPHCTTRFDFSTCTVESLHNIEMPFNFEISRPCLIHGIAGWFDAIFEGTDSVVTLSTAPWQPGTHWYQIRFLLETPLAVNAGQNLVGTVKMDANNLQSYYVKVHMTIDGTNIVSEAKCVDLKDPEYRFYSSPNTYVPPGTASAFGQQAATAGAEAPAAAPPQPPPQGGCFPAPEVQNAAPKKCGQNFGQDGKQPVAAAQKRADTSARSRSPRQQAK